MKTVKTVLSTSALTGAVALALIGGLAGCSRQSDAELTDAAKAALEAKDTKGAIIHLKNALQKSPDAGEARFLLGKTLLEAGDPVAALVELRKAQELQVDEERVVPELARAMVLVGEEGNVVLQFAETHLKTPAATADLKTSLATAYTIQHRLDQAREAAADALRTLPGYAPAIILQARLTASEGDGDGALALLDQLLQREPANDQAGVLRGELLWHGKRDPDAALVAFRQVLTAKPTSVAARSSIANILLQQAKVDEAKADIEQLKKTSPGHPETLYLEAQVAFNEQNYKLTREISDRILKAMPNNVRVLELAGAAEFKSKNWLQAEALLGRALKLAPKQPVTRMLLAQTFLRSGQPEKAVETLGPLVSTDRPHPGGLLLAGEAYLQMGDNRRSEDAYQRALKIAPGSTQVRTSAAVAQLVRGGNTAGAITELEALAHGDAGPRADMALAAAKLRQGDIAGAMKAVDTLEKKLPDQPLAFNMRGRLLLLKKDIPGATKSFEAALSKDPNYFPAVSSLAAIDLAQGKPAEARKRFEAVLAAQPKNYRAKLALAELEIRDGSPQDKVLGLLRDAVKLNPSEATPHLILINNLMRAGEGTAALAAAQDAAAALPQNPDITDALGRAQLSAGDTQRALSTFKQLAAQQPRNPTPEMRLADVYLAQKDNAEAARSLRRALKLQPDLVPAKRGLAALAMLDKKPQDALTIARELQQSRPKDNVGLLLEAEIEASRDNWDGAAAAYRRALALPGTPETTAELAPRLHMALLSGKKTAEAERFSTEWLKDHPKDIAFRYYLGDVTLHQNELARAEAHYRSVLELKPDHALALNNVAWLMARQNKPGAVAVAEKANALLPNRAALLDTLATALAAENQLPKAIETQKRAIALEPKDPSLTLHLAKLYIKTGDKPRARAELDALVQLGDKFRDQAEVKSLLQTL